MSLADLALTEAALPDDPPDTGHTPGPPPDWQTLDRQAFDRQVLDQSAHDLPADDESNPQTSTVRASALERHVEHLLALAA
jgi:hypothetical protein